MISNHRDDPANRGGNLIIIIYVMKRTKSNTYYNNYYKEIVNYNYSYDIHHATSQCSCENACLNTSSSFVDLCNLETVIVLLFQC